MPTDAVRSSPASGPDADDPSGDATASGGAGTLHLQLLRTPRLIKPGGSALALPEKDAALLALLVVEGPLSRPAAAKLLWPATDDGRDGAPLRRAGNNLRQRLFRINRWAGRVVVAHTGPLTLAADVRHDLDLSADRFLADARSAPGDLLGELGFDLDTELGVRVEAARRRWRARRADLLITLITRLEADGRIAEALQLAGRLVADEPVMEHAARILMRLHHRRGDRGAAIDEFERCRKALYAQHGEPPSDETIQLSVAIGHGHVPDAPPVRALPLSLRHPPRTIGRDEVLEACEHRWQLGGAVLLLGVAGIGKTRILHELCARWRIDVSLQAVPASAHEAYGLVRQLARQLLPRIADGADPHVADWLHWLAGPLDRPPPIDPVPRAKLVEILAWALQRAADRGLQGLAVDDLHFADPPSLEVLCELLPAAGRTDTHVAPAQARWLLAARDTELPEVVRAWCERQPAGHAPAVTLGPLPAVATRELLESIGMADDDLDQVAARMHRHCGGHPLFTLQVLRQLQVADRLGELARMAQLPMPEEAMVSVSQRLARAEPQAQQMAYLAALCAGEVDAGLMCQLMHGSASSLLAPWRRLEELHIFDSRGFAHDLVRQVVAAAVPQALLPWLHREIAQVLPATDTHAARRAHHWTAAGDARQAADAWLEAARLSRSCGLEQQAIEQLEAAAKQYRAAQEHDRALHCDWRAGHLRVGYGSARDVVEIARRLADSARDPGQRALALELSAKARIELHDLQALTDAEAALEAARLSGMPQRVALCRLRLATARTLTGDVARSLAELQVLAEQPELLDEDSRHEIDADMTSVLALLGRRREAVGLLQAAVERNRRIGHLARASFAAGNCATHLSYLGHLDQAVAMAQQAVAWAREAGVERGAVLVDEMGLAGNLGDLGRFDEALSMAERVQSQLEAAGMDVWALNAANDRAMIYLRLGRPDLATQLLGPAPDSAPVWVRAARQMARARLEQWRGQPAFDQIRRAEALFHEGGVVLDSYAGQKLALERARADAPAVALQQAEQAAQWAHGHEYVAFERQADLVSVEALHRLGRRDDAAQRAAQVLAIDGLSQQTFGLYWPEMLWTLGVALQAGGCTDLGARALQGGVDWVLGCRSTHVPAVFRDSFVDRNPVNARLLNWQRRARVTAG